MLRIPKSVMGDIRAHMEDAYPHECCGLIIGSVDDGARVAAVARRCRNLNTARARDRYELDPKDMLRAQRELDGGPWDIVGIYHSHPDHPSRPSGTDLAHAWAGWSYVIGSVVEGRVASVQSWELADGGDRFEEESVDIPPAGGEES